MNLNQDDLNQDSLKEAAGNARPEAVIWGRGGSEMQDPLDIDDIEEIEMVDDFNIHQNDMIHQLNPPMAPQPGQKHQNIFDFTHQQVNVGEEAPHREPNEQTSAFRPSEPHMKRTNHNTAAQKSLFEHPEQDNQEDEEDYYDEEDDQPEIIV